MNLCFDRLVPRSPAHDADRNGNLPNEACFTLTFQLHGDGCDRFSAGKTQDHLPSDNIEVGVPWPLVVQGDSYGHDATCRSSIDVCKSVRQI